jgi:hypothetical protein
VIVSDDEDKKLENVIEFPYHKLRENSVSTEEKYVDALDRFNPSEMEDSTLVATLQSCPLFVIGDVFDPKWWSRRLAWMVRIGMSTNHPIVADVFREAKHCTLIDYSFPKLDLCWFDEDKMISAIKISTDKTISQNDISVAERSLDRKGHNPKKYLIAFFEPDPKINTTDWEVIPMVDFSYTFHDMADTLGENLDMARSLDDCGSWMLLLDEFTTRYLSYYNRNDANGTAAMRYFAEQLGIDKILDKVAKQGTGLF